MSESAVPQNWRSRALSLTRHFATFCNRILTCTDGCLFVAVSVCVLTANRSPLDRPLTWLSMCPALSWHWYLTTHGEPLQFQNHMVFFSVLCLCLSILKSLMQGVVVLSVWLCILYCHYVNRLSGLSKGTMYMLVFVVSFNRTHIKLLRGSLTLCDTDKVIESVWVSRFGLVCLTRGQGVKRSQGLGLIMAPYSLTQSVYHELA